MIIVVILIITISANTSPSPDQMLAPSTSHLSGWIPFGDHPLELERYREN